MRKLLFAFSYFSLQNREKSLIDLVPTAILAAALSAPFIVIPSAYYFRTGGFLDKLLLLTVALTAFYVAALVAVATFSLPDLDKPIEVGAVIALRRDDDGVKRPGKLTRRELASAIFGYLAMLSLLLSVSIGVAIPMGDVGSSEDHKAPIWLIHLLKEDWVPYVRGILIYAFNLGVAHLIVVTALGLYYLMDRLNRKEPQVTTPKRYKDAA